MTGKNDDTSPLQCARKRSFNWRSSLISSFISLDLLYFLYVLLYIANSFIVDLLWSDLVHYFTLSLLHHCVSLPYLFFFVVVIRLTVFVCLLHARRDGLVRPHLVPALHSWWLFRFSLVPLLAWTYVVDLIANLIENVVVKDDGLISSGLILRLFFFKVLSQS